MSSEQGGIVVHTDQHLGATAAGEGQRVLDELPSARLLLGRHRVLEVEHDGIGATVVGLLHEAPDVDGQDEGRAAGVRGGHRQMIPFCARVSMRSSE